ncbi:MAG: 2'-5' RNA ligase family protein [Dehalococcoidia bacterium]
MPGVISLLPEPFASGVERLWGSMHREFGIPMGYPGAVPHITFHLGARDAEPGAAGVVEAVAKRTVPFSITTAGFGVFGGPEPVVHLAVARSPQVARLAAELESALAAAGYPTTDPYFTPDRWMPHITIAHRNLAGIELGSLLAWLVSQPLSWEIPLSTLSVARETELSADVLATFPLSGRAVG